MKAFSILGAALATAVLFWTLFVLNGEGHSEQGAGEAPKVPPKLTLPPGTPAEQVQALIQQHEKAVAALRKLYDAAKTEEEKTKLEALFPDPDPYANLLLQIAEQNPKEPAAVDALLWTLRNGGLPSAKAQTILIRDHHLSPKIGPLCMFLRHKFTEAESVAFLRKVLAENPNKEAQASAAYALTKITKARAFWTRKLPKADAKELAGFNKDFLTYLKNADANVLEKEAEALLEKIQKDKALAETTYPIDEVQVKFGVLAGAELFEMRHLQPGKVVPEIVGEDIDGKPMKLSDYRGKVVLLEFCGYWCSSCKLVRQHGLLLVKKFEGKPFAIVGVNSDTNREKTKELAAKEKITWRCFWDGGSVAGPIQRQWNIEGYPTVYLIDHNGLFVGKWLPGEKGDQLIAQKVQEAEAAAQK